jgi:hypothetical protein
VASTSEQALLEVVGRYPSSRTEVDSRYVVFSGGAAGVATHDELAGKDIIAARQASGGNRCPARR